jgi:hypothetical protein
MNQQGVTGFLDAIGAPEDLAAFSAAVRKAGKLTARAHFAPLIRPADAGALDAAVARVVAARSRIRRGSRSSAAPGVTVRNAKLFLDGVIAAPAFTGAMLEPYRTNVGQRRAAALGAGAEPRTGRVFSPPAALGDRASRRWAAPGSIRTCTRTATARSARRLDAIAALRAALPACRRSTGDRA